MRISFFALCVAATCVLWGCEKSSPPAAPPDAAALAAQLARADAADGTSDKIVSKCARCNLGMEGSSAHSLKLAGYELHFCSDDCKKAYETDPAGSVMALKIK